MLISELPAAAMERDEVGRSLVRLAIVADRLLEETAHAVVDRGQLPDWSSRQPRNAAMLDAYRAEVESTMPEWQAPPPARPRRSLISRLLGTGR
jgi:hypothetical protein